MDSKLSDIMVQLHCEFGKAREALRFDQRRLHEDQSTLTDDRRKLNEERKAFSAYMGEAKEHFVETFEQFASGAGQEVEPLAGVHQAPQSLAVSRAGGLDPAAAAGMSPAHGANVDMGEVGRAASQDTAENESTGPSEGKQCCEVDSNVSEVPANESIVIFTPQTPSNDSKVDLAVRMEKALNGLIKQESNETKGVRSQWLQAVALSDIHQRIWHTWMRESFHEFINHYFTRSEMILEVILAMETLDAAGINRPNASDVIACFKKTKKHKHDNTADHFVENASLLPNAKFTPSASAHNAGPVTALLSGPLETHGGPELLQTPCTHRFCKWCIKRWLCLFDACPTCHSPTSSEYLDFATMNDEDEENVVPLPCLVY